MTFSESEKEPGPDTASPSRNPASPFRDVTKPPRGVAPETETGQVENSSPPATSPAGEPLMDFQGPSAPPEEAHDSSDSRYSPYT